MKPILSALLLLIAVPAVASADEAANRLEAERLDQSGTVITIIFDDSGSMRGEKIEQAKTAFREWLGTVPGDYRIGLVALNGGTLSESRRGNKSEVADAVAKIRANGGTPLADTIAGVMKNIRQRQKQLPFERHVLVVFTDGEDSTNRGAAGVREELRKASQNLVETVGIGFHGQGDYMSGVATRYFDAGNTEELRRGLEKVDAEIGDTTDIVISDDILRDMKTIGLASLANSSAPVPAPAPVPASPPGVRINPLVLGFGILVAAMVISRILKALK